MLFVKKNINVNIPCDYVFSEISKSISKNENYIPCNLNNENEICIEPFIKSPYYIGAKPFLFIKATQLKNSVKVSFLIRQKKITIIIFLNFFMLIHDIILPL